VLRERVAAATEGDDWVTDSTYHSMLGNMLPERADHLVWLDLPVPLVMWRLIRRTHARKRDRTVLWNGNIEPGWRESIPYLIWPSFKVAFKNRRRFPVRYAHLNVHRLRSDREVREFVQSIQATATTSGSSGVSARQKTPPLTET
jgi:adenylate kinase family enzyme